MRLTVTVNPSPTSPAEQRGEIPLTAIRIVHRIVRHVDGTSIELALGWDVRDAGRSFLPKLLTSTVSREECCGPQDRWEAVYILGNGWVRIY